MKTILFQGDSITDAFRGSDSLSGLGTGYPNHVASSLGCDCPGQYTFINKGISGNRIVDVYARIKCDIINLKPDIMSILVGVNDVWHNFSCNNGVATEKFETIYRLMLDEITAELPDIKIMIMEPFCLLGSATREYWDSGFAQDVKEKAAAAKRVAHDFKLPFIALQDKLDAASRDTQTSVWLADGVHPAPAGHELIKREWLRAFGNL